MNPEITQETLEMFKAQLRDQLINGAFVDPELAKAFTTGLGLVFYDLEPAAKILYPVITPLRNAIPRLPGRGGTSTHWKVITAVNATRQSPGISEGNRGAPIVTTLSDKLALYKTLGVEDYVTFEAELAAAGFDDAKARAVEGELRALMISEERTLVGANTGNAIGVTPTPTCADIVVGGAIHQTKTIDVYCVALTYDGYIDASVVNGVPQAVVRTAIDGDTDTYGGGAALRSAKGSAVTATDGAVTHAIGCYVDPVPGAVAYAWFCGDHAGTPGTILLTAITTINSYIYTGLETQGTQVYSDCSAAVDYSTNALLYDGFFATAAGGPSGAMTPYTSMVMGSAVAGLNGGLLMPLKTGTIGTGSTLTSDGAGGVAEIDVMLKAFWDNYRLAPTDMWCNAQEVTNINKKVIGGGGAPLFRFNTDAQGTVAGRQLTGGSGVDSYFNKYAMGGGAMVTINLHPDVPPGTILFDHSVIPYPLSNVANVRAVRLQRDYYQIEWPIKKRRYEYGIYTTGVFQHYFPPALGLLFNIANG